jgi:hypothetical protein
VGSGWVQRIGPTSWLDGQQTADFTDDTNWLGARFFRDSGRIADYHHHGFGPGRVPIVEAACDRQAFTSR